MLSGGDVVLEAARGAVGEGAAEVPPFSSRDVGVPGRGLEGV